MSENTALPFRRLLARIEEQGPLGTDDLLGVVLPLFRQVRAAHEAGSVCQFRGIATLEYPEERHLALPASAVVAPSHNRYRVTEIDRPESRAIEVLGETRLETDVGTGGQKALSLDVVEAGTAVTRPVFVSGYGSWEEALGHHDALTDIFCLGQLAASLATGLDFTETEDLSRFASARGNLFSLAPSLHPVLVRTIGEMTALSRHRRAQDIDGIIARLENYRDVRPEEADLTHGEAFARSAAPGRRCLIQERLRDRLFEISRRNRLLHFKPTLQTLNLTVASVPVVMDHRNIRPEQICFWHDSFAQSIRAGGEVNLGRYLRLEEASYLPGVLDKIIAEARRDRAEFGFAQLRLVLVFLRWHNLREEVHERIHSPLLLLPVGLSKKKGVRDSYVLEPSGTEAEVNPVLRHHLKELYRLELPESIDLRETSLGEFHESLSARIQASEPGVVLRRIDKPQIRLIHEKARQRLDQWRRRQAVRPTVAKKLDYSYESDDYRPLGLRLFLDKVRPTPAPLRDAPKERFPRALPDTSDAGTANEIATERRLYTLEEGGEANPYAWDFDLCNLTLGNFNYRKMTLVRDYSSLIEGDLASQAFDSVFSVSPRPNEDAPTPLPLAERYLVVPADATQVSAIARARTGASYIIQGPPGTGKSQTITNLIADFVARGKRVLFVCEKRAAIDVVFHRLRQQGLDELCCLIHDSQTDKKAFIQNLRQTYEGWLAQGGDTASEKARRSALSSLADDLEVMERFSATMEGAPSEAGLRIRELLTRLVELEAPFPPVDDLEKLPHYADWLAHGSTVRRVSESLAELGSPPVLARHPLRMVGPGVVQAPRPLETFRHHLEAAQNKIEAVEGALELSGLPGELWDTLGEIHALLRFAAETAPLAEAGLLGLLDPSTETSRRLASATAELERRGAALEKARNRNAAWREKLSPTDTSTALAQARDQEASFLRFFKPSWHRLRKLLAERYDFSRHAIAPPFSKVLEELAAEHVAETAWNELSEETRRSFPLGDLSSLQSLSSRLRGSPDSRHPSVAALARKIVADADSAELVASLAALNAEFAALHGSLSLLLSGHEDLGIPGLTLLLEELRGASGQLLEVVPALREVAALPADFARSVREVDLVPASFEAASAHRTLSTLCRADRFLAQAEGRSLSRRMGRFSDGLANLGPLNASVIRARVRSVFLEHVRVSAAPAAQLDANGKAFKKEYSAGRRDLENEFGKTMRHKSIRDLAAGPTGAVVRDLKPVWLMSPLSVSDTLPLEPDLFDVVIFDEASQIPVEEAVPAVYRAPQVIVVGDEMQLPPTSFFASAREDDDSVVAEEGGARVEFGLDADSFLTQASRNLPSTLLAWHYRSRSEALISFSNAAFYSGNLRTVPDRRIVTSGLPPITVTEPGDAVRNTAELLSRSISFHLMARSPYEGRRNPGEAAYIAHLVRELLRRGTGLSIGIAAFSEAQQGEIESALANLAAEDSAFATLLEAEENREEDDQFCGLFVKNLENIQGDERDIILLSVCYGPDASGRMLMNFGPINQRGGEKRLNVIFSRAKRHLALVSSIRHVSVTNDYNDGAAALKGYLNFAECVSRGDLAAARVILAGLNPLARERLAPAQAPHPVVTQLAAALAGRGLLVELGVGQSLFRCDLAVRPAGCQEEHHLGILVDTPAHYANPDILERYWTQPGILRAFGWKICLVLTKDWLENSDGVLARIERLLDGGDDPVLPSEPPPPPAPEPAAPSPAASPPAAPEGPTPAPPGGLVENHRLECREGGSSKFWEATLAGLRLTIRFGRIGTAGQSQEKTFADEAKARSELRRLVREKLAKGYQEAKG